MPKHVGKHVLDCAVTAKLILLSASISACCGMMAQPNADNSTLIKVLLTIVTQTNTLICSLLQFINELCALLIVDYKN